MSQYSGSTLPHEPSLLTGRKTSIRGGRLRQCVARRAAVRVLLFSRFALAGSATDGDADAAREGHVPPTWAFGACTHHVLVRLIGGDSGVNHEEIGFWRQRTRLVNVVLELVERLSETSAADARDIGT